MLHHLLNLFSVALRRARLLALAVAVLAVGLPGLGAAQATDSTWVVTLSVSSENNDVSDDSEIKVSWPAYTGAAKYVVQWKRSNVVQPSDGSISSPEDYSATERRAEVSDDTSYLMEDLPRGYLYTVRVTAVDSADQSLAFSAEASIFRFSFLGGAYLMPTPGDARSIRVTVLPQPSSPTAPNSPTGPAGEIVGYVLDWVVKGSDFDDKTVTYDADNRVATAAADWQRLVPPPTAPKSNESQFYYDVGGLQPDTKYFFRVRTYSSLGTAANPDGDTDDTTVGTLDRTHSEITSLTASLATGTVDELDATWALGSAENALAVEGYVVQWKLATASAYPADNKAEVAADITTYRIDGLAANTAYDVRVTARVDIGPSLGIQDGDSIESRGTTRPPAPPPPPGGGGGGGGGFVPLAEPDPDPVPPPPPVQFTDVNDDDAHGDSIDVLAAGGTVQGCSSDPPMFCPDVPVTRAQIASLLVRALKLPEAPPQGFNDVGSTGPHSTNIDSLSQAGIAVGCSSDPPSFCPNQPVTRAQMASLLVRALDLPEAPAAGFADVDSDGVHAPAIDALYAAGIALGCSTEPLSFCPDEPVTRAQMASFLVRALNRLTESA